MLYSIIILVLAAGLAFIPASIAKEKGYSFGLWWFYGWMLFIVAIIHVSIIPNKNPETFRPPVPHCPSSCTSAEEIAQYKKLLDEGAITEEEFEAKKKQILNL